MKKEKYETPLMEIIVFKADDIITTSPGDLDLGNAEGDVNPFEPFKIF